MQGVKVEGYDGLNIVILDHVFPIFKFLLITQIFTCSSRSLI